MWSLHDGRDIGYRVTCLPHMLMQCQREFRPLGIWIYISDLDGTLSKFENRQCILVHARATLASPKSRA